VGRAGGAGRAIFQTRWNQHLSHHAALFVAQALNVRHGKSRKRRLLAVEMLTSKDIGFTGEASRSPLGPLQTCLSRFQ